MPSYVYENKDGRVSLIHSAPQWLLKAFVNKKSKYVKNRLGNELFENYSFYVKEVCIRFPDGSSLLVDFGSRVGINWGKISIDLVHEIMSEKIVYLHLIKKVWSEKIDNIMQESVKKAFLENYNSAKDFKIEIVSEALISRKIVENLPKGVYVTSTVSVKRGR